MVGHDSHEHGELRIQGYARDSQWTRPNSLGHVYGGDTRTMHSNPRIQAMYQCLKVKGKPAKVITAACMRKLLTILN